MHLIQCYFSIVCIVVEFIFVLNFFLTILSDFDFYLACFILVVIVIQLKHFISVSFFYVFIYIFHLFIIFNVIF